MHSDDAWQPRARSWERFVRSIKEECLNKLILFVEVRLRRALEEYTAHYHLERNHQGVGNELLEPVDAADETPSGEIGCRERLGGLLRFYYRGAA